MTPDERLLALINERFGSKLALAKKLNIPYTSFCYLLRNGIDTMPVKKYKILCDELEIPYALLLGDANSSDKTLLLCSAEELAAIEKCRNNPELGDTMLRILNIK